MLPFQRRKASKTGFHFLKTVSGISLMKICWSFIWPENQKLGSCRTTAPDSVQGNAREPLLSHSSVKSSVLWRWSLKLYESRVPPAACKSPAFLMDSSTAAQKTGPYFGTAVIWRQFCGDFWSSDVGWDTPTDLGRFRLNSRAAALGSCHPSALAGSRAGRWQEAMAKSELQNQQMNT